MDAVREIESHLRERVLSADGAPNERDALEKILAELGPPLRVAQAYSTERTIDEAVVTGKVVSILSALLFPAAQRLTAPPPTLRGTLVATLGTATAVYDVEAPIDADNQGVLYLNSHVGYDDITDGPAYTILLGEVRRGAPTLGWAAGTRGTLRNTGSRINEPDPLIPGPGSSISPSAMVARDHLGPDLSG